jgi:hypothetical protein
LSDTYAIKILTVNTVKIEDKNIKKFKKSLRQGSADRLEKT